MTITLVPDAAPDTSELAAESSALVQQANALTITDDASYRTAAEFGKGIMALKKKIADFFLPHKKRAHDLHKALCSDEAAQLEPVEQAEAIVKRSVLAYRIAEAKREQELQRQREAQALKLEEDRQLQAAIDAEEEGDHEAAAAIIAAPIETPVVRMQATTPKVSGVAGTKRWSYDELSVDLHDVIRHIAGLPPGAKLAHPALVNLLKLDSASVRQRISADREHFNVPGIRAYQVEGVSFGSK